MALLHQALGLLRIERAGVDAAVRRLRALGQVNEVAAVGQEVSPQVKDALQRVVQLRSALDDLRAQRTRLDQRTAEITAEHARIRENMQRLQQNSDLYNRYVKKLDQQETELEKLRKDIESLKSKEDEQRRELQNYVMNLDVA